MNNKMRKMAQLRLHQIVPALALGFVGTALFASALNGAEWNGKVMKVDRKLEIAKDGSFKFSVPVGSVTIENHDEAFIEYHGQFKAKNNKDADRVFPHLKEKSSVRGDRTELVIEWANKKAPKNSGLSGEHVLKIPKAASIDISTAGGSIKLGDRGGAVAVRCSGGSILAGKVLSQFSAITSGGSIAVGDCDGNAALNTSGGSIKTGHIHGSLVAKTSGGSINVGNISGHVEAKTSGGSIKASLKSQIQKPVNLVTSGGNINLTVNPDFRATLDAKTSGGRVVCDLPMKVSGKFSKKMIQGAVNGGGPKITMRTSGGNIRLSKF